MSVDVRTATRRQAVDAAWHHLTVHHTSSARHTAGTIERELVRVRAYQTALADLLLTPEPNPEQLTLG